MVLAGMCIGMAMMEFEKAYKVWRWGRTRNEDYYARRIVTALMYLFFATTIILAAQQLGVL